ncbi:solute carrier organic anion transporter family member 4C1-like [Maniola jurtina]|uniref:solute carrier organic anion transporter family member 4C1-like n=1 Tax=Maniola jurtina TaxID=191418 RepID=UPI001E68CF06|nr:solute carrier organic anion transporter family member 4C1-like [Maniola jurtina]XP_045779467.1 solute carrier organic anion transporter family member 4C1-like [Maniola jurtina]
MSLLVGGSTICAKVLERVKSWINPKSFNVARFRGIVMGVMIGTTLGEICAYKLLQQDTRAGDLPAYTIDVTILVVALFEVLVAPFVSWWGFKNRRSLLIGYTTVTLVIFLSWYFLPGHGNREESEFCNGTNDTAFHGVPATTVARLIIIILSCITFVLTRVAWWSHGIAYCDEFAPERTSVHYALVLLARVIPMILGHRLLTNDVDNNMTIQTVFMMVGFTPNLVQLFLLLPKTAPKVKGVQKTALPDEHRDFFTSISRVCSNPLATSQMFAMGLMSAALFSYMHNEVLVVKVKFNLVPERNGTVNVAELFQYIFLMFVVGFAGNLYAKPISTEFRSAAVMKQIIRSTIFVIIFYVLLTLAVRCDHGYVSGLSNDSYGNPECSLSCGCEPRMREFEPVCVVDDMVTYVSPCQAGCGGQEFVHGIRSYTNCTCSESGRAVVGACSDVSCTQAYRLHSMMLLVIVVFTLLTLHAQGVLLLRTVDPRDRSVVMGMTWSMVTLMTFVCGYMLFIGINVATCRWFDFEGKQCHLQTSKYPYHVGGTCTFLALISLLISIMSTFSIQKANKSIENTRL